MGGGCYKPVVVAPTPTQETFLGAFLRYDILVPISMRAREKRSIIEGVPV